MTNVINSATSMSTARTTLMRMFIFGASNMFERRLGRKPVLPLILNGGSWIAKPLRLARLSAVSSKLVSFSRWGEG